ncbi:hypothetical protein IKE_06250 [Bacillus cereus VD196]|uniref:Uncharacterized protein n=1 Tax=Bacillus cereus VD196 TaxID=1053243 RepID=A0A9W5PXS6_BACCE|nr:hypothetical protein IKG_06042 [Bacillus cereus VD200]EOO58635.1 hypothetical protein IKE_06250 [Bacillus cereus VD196]
MELLFIHFEKNKGLIMYTSDNYMSVIITRDN